ncbi:hypothetical protein GCM10027568_20670 [Humibacter soli]
MDDEWRAPVRLVVHPSAVTIPASAPHREPPRPIALRPLGYEDQFDSETLFFDVFRAGDQVVAMGPPLLNLETELPSWTFHSDGEPITRPAITTLDRSHRARFRAPRDARELTISAGSSDQTVPIGTDLSSVFAGTRALMTLQLDNDLEWIRDWVRWHVAAQGTDAVVVYDNGSKRYALTDILDAIGVPGIRVAAVVDWRFRYGPQGSSELPWDSDYTQYGAIEHARRRLLRHSAGMLSVDIDELVYSKGVRTAYECAEESPQGFVLFAGTWAYADPDDADPKRLRHADCRWTRAGDPDAATKWCAVPSRLPRRAQLVVHGAHDVTMPTSPIAYWHLRPISTHWKVDRSRSEHAADEYARDPLLASQMDLYLGASEGLPPVRPARRTWAPAARARGLITLTAWRMRAFAARLAGRR